VERLTGGIDAATTSGSNAGGGQAPPDDREVALRAEGITKTYGETRVLDQVSFALQRGHIHCLLGSNGSGKSTFIKILAGVVKGDAGGSFSVMGTTVEADGVTPGFAQARRMHFVHQDPAVFAELTVADNLVIDRGFPRNVLGGIQRRRLHREAGEWLERFNIDIDPASPMKLLRPATRTMVAIARALRESGENAPSLLILDEPTAALPEPDVKLLLATLREQATLGHTILYVTHALPEVLAVADAVTILRDGQNVATLERPEIVETTLIRHIVGHDLAERGPSKDPRGGGSAMLRVDGISVGRLKNVTFSVSEREVVGLAGLQGSGRSTLLKAVFGARSLEDGRIFLAGSEAVAEDPCAAVKLGIAYVPEDRAGDAAFMELTLADNLAIADLGRFWRWGVMRSRTVHRWADSTIDTFGIRATGPRQLMSRLSGGNQQKAVLARWMVRNPRLLLLDEPTQGVDVGARQDLYGMIRTSVGKGASVLLASSDHEELAEICDRVLVLRGGGIAAQLTSGEISPERITHLTYVDGKDTV
jgi:ribose transport system ATP-binding protein